MTESHQYQVGDLMYQPVLRDDDSDTWGGDYPTRAEAEADPIARNGGTIAVFRVTSLDADGDVSGFEEATS